MATDNAERISKSFFNAASGTKTGTDIWPAIQQVEGRGGEPIALSTVHRWEHQGLVRIKTRKPVDGEHHRAKPIVSVTTTAKATKLVKESRVWREANNRPEAG